jgi:hypothetical protein
VLGTRALNRALLARQLLLERSALPAIDAIDHLIGLQGQEPLEPYVGLWSRLDGFDPDELVDLLETRQVVRTVLMRRTLHVMSAADTLALRSLFQPMLETRMNGTLRKRLPSVDIEELRAAGLPLFAEQPRTVTDVGRAVVDRWPGVTPRDLGDALSSLVPLVQVPPRGLWGRTGPARNTTIEAWLGRPLQEPAEPPDRLVLRYLAAYGPASTADMRAWCGLSGLRQAFARLRPELVVFRDERRRELFDVPDGLRPDPDRPVAPRFLPAFDNAVLGFDDRSRIIDDAHRSLSVEGARVLLVDGRVAGTWRVDQTGDRSTLQISMLWPLGRAERAEVVDEGARLLAFITDGADGTGGTDSAGVAISSA